MNTLHVSGMHCEHCRKAVTDAVLGVLGVTSAQVDLQQGVVTYETAPNVTVSADAVKAAITRIGFDVA